MSIATNGYLEYWKAMVQSADCVTEKQDRVKFFVFTEDVEAVEGFKQKLTNVEVSAFEIPPYGWPEATLLRYKVFHSYSDFLDTDLLVYLDADMLIKSNPWKRIKNNLLENSICLVEHPGYSRPTGLSKIILYFFYPVTLLKDIMYKVKYGGLGRWEENCSSEAYVEKDRREKYFCGGIWFGTRNAISDLVERLASAVQADQERNITAIWHDESHLNRWATENTHGVETSELCYNEKYPQLKKLEPVIVAVTKVKRHVGHE